MFKMATEPSIEHRSPGAKVKTIYVGFHDGEKPGVTPFLKYEPEPIQVKISHKDAARIVNFLYDALKEMVEEPIPEQDNHGQWS